MFRIKYRTIPIKTFVYFILYLPIQILNIKFTVADEVPLLTNKQSVQYWSTLIQHYIHNLTLFKVPRKLRKTLDRIYQLLQTTIQFVLSLIEIQIFNLKLTA